MMKTPRSKVVIQYPGGNVKEIPVSLEEDGDIEHRVEQNMAIVEEALDNYCISLPYGTKIYLSIKSRQE